MTTSCFQTSNCKEQNDEYFHCLIHENPSEFPETLLGSCVLKGFIEVRFSQIVTNSKLVSTFVVLECILFRTANMFPLGTIFYLLCEHPFIIFFLSSELSNRPATPSHLRVV
jgi:hypothetical protein